MQNCHNFLIILKQSYMIMPLKGLNKKIVSKPLNILESENQDQNNNKKCLTAGYAFFKVKRFNLWATAMNRQFLLYINSTI